MVNREDRVKRGKITQKETAEATPLYSLPPPFVAVSTPKEHHFPG
jgi:hypothetical protein